MKELIDKIIEKSVEDTRRQLSAENVAKQEMQMGKLAEGIRGDGVSFSGNADSTERIQARQKELNAKISELADKITDDYELLADEIPKSREGYNPVISGARHRISVHENLLNRYKNELDSL